VTFSATLFEGAKWYGWYADEAHTQLVSKDLDYTIIAGEDITLYAYASLGTGLYLKKDNQWINSINIYKKINGEWIDIGKADFNVNGNYTLEFLE
jgi:hypothetical protein